MPQTKSGSSNISSNQTLTDTKCPSKADNQSGDQSRGRGIRKRSRKGGRHVNSIVSIRGRNGAGEAQNTKRPESPKTKVEMIRTTSKGPFLGTSQFNSMRSVSSRSRNASSHTATLDGSGHAEMDNRAELRMMRERSTDGLETQTVRPLSTENTLRSTWDIFTPESGQSLSEVGTRHESKAAK
jgi:hypothetical protein